MFLRWLNEVRKELKALVTGSLLLGVLGLYQAITSGKVPSSAYAAIALVFLGWAFFGAWAREHRAREALSSPAMTFRASYSATAQTSSENLPVVLQRIGITNDSAIGAEGCELVISKFPIDVPGLSPDTPLNVKDANVRKIDINRKSTRHFDLFITYDTAKEEWPHGTYVMAPNSPSIPWREAPEIATVGLILTGANFDPQLWDVKIRLDCGKVEILNIAKICTSGVPT